VRGSMQQQQQRGGRVVVGAAEEGGGGKTTKDENGDDVMIPLDNLDARYWKGQGGGGPYTKTLLKFSYLLVSNSLHLDVS
jgi:hypothetical protein